MMIYYVSEIFGNEPFCNLTMMFLSKEYITEERHCFCRVFFTLQGYFDNRPEREQLPPKSATV